MMSLSVIIVVSTTLLLIDAYVYKSLRLLLKRRSFPKQKTFAAIYWSLSLLIIAGLVFVDLQRNPSSYTNQGYFYGFYIMGIVIVLLATKLVLFFFHFIDDGTFFLKRSYQKLNKTQKHTNQSRRLFITKLGLGVAALPFSSLLYGILKGRFDFKFFHQSISFEHLPSNFQNFKIVQISDLHLGSFFEDFHRLDQVIEQINATNPDIIVITGDIVNHFAQELIGWEHSFATLQAKYGKFAVLGNHDYGDYIHWPSPQAKAKNLENIKQFYKTTGFQLLLNQHKLINVNNEHIAIVGVENWGLPPFKQYGNLQQALLGLDDKIFKILLSHDPTHFEEQVKGRLPISLTLSGHTHGMQFGVEIGNFRWSPIKYKYPRWAGLYQDNNQYLYVNRGLGYIGFPGRVGILPEVTVITLKTKASMT